MGPRNQNLKTAGGAEMGHVAGEKSQDDSRPNIHNRGPLTSHHIELLLLRSNNPRFSIYKHFSSFSILFPPHHSSDLQTIPSSLSMT